MSVRILVNLHCTFLALYEQWIMYSSSIAFTIPITPLKFITADFVTFLQHFKKKRMPKCYRHVILQSAVSLLRDHFRVLSLAGSSEIHYEISNLWIIRYCKKCYNPWLIRAIIEQNLTRHYQQLNVAHIARTIGL